MRPHRWQELKEMSQRPLIIFQMGKVGSMSIYSSLQSSGLEGVFHTHDLSQSKDPHFSDYLQERGCDVITLSKDPLAMMLSGFFENAEVMVGMTWEEIGAQSVDRLLDLFWEDRGKKGFQYALRWFDRRFYPQLGINIYDYQTPREKGYSHIEAGNIRVLILQAELKDALKEKVIGSFVSRANFSLKRENDAQAKPYAKVYKEFLKRISFKESFLDEVYSSQLVQHFYTPAQIQHFRERWESKGEVGV